MKQLSTYYDFFIGSRSISNVFVSIHKSSGSYPFVLIHVCIRSDWTSLLRCYIYIKTITPYDDFCLSISTILIQCDFCELRDPTRSDWSHVRCLLEFIITWNDERVKYTNCTVSHTLTICLLWLAFLIPADLNYVPTKKFNKTLLFDNLR